MSFTVTFPQALLAFGLDESLVTLLMERSLRDPIIHAHLTLAEIGQQSVVETLVQALVSSSENRDRLVNDLCDAKARLPFRAAK
jgi:hypothetical protein